MTMPRQAVIINRQDFCQSPAVWGVFEAFRACRRDSGSRQACASSEKSEIGKKHSNWVLTLKPTPDYIRSTPTATPHGDAATALL